MTRKERLQAELTKLEAIDKARERKENRSWWKRSAKLSIMIRRVLSEHDVTFEEFAEMLDVPLEQVLEWLSGRYNFDLKTIAKIENKLKEIVEL